MTKQRKPSYIVAIVGGVLGLIGGVGTILFGSPVKDRSEPATRECDDVVGRAITVIGDQEEALRWMGTPVAALGYRTPISLLGTADGRRRVRDVLMQLEHGVW